MRYRFYCHTLCLLLFLMIGVNHQSLHSDPSLTSSLSLSPVEQVQTPCGITCTQDGSCIITDGDTRTLHLVTSDGVWVRQLWAHPAGANRRDELSTVCSFQNVCLCCTEDGLYSVCVFQNVCLCCTVRGSVFVLDIS